jgi:hypothetical protein
MACDISLWIVTPGEQQARRHVGIFSIRDVEFRGQTVEMDKCLDIDVEMLPRSQPVQLTRGDSPVPAAFVWLALAAEIWTTQPPRRRVGRIVIDEQGMLEVGTGHAGPARWRWVVQPDDVETVERVRAAQPSSPLYFDLQVEGIVKMIDRQSGQIADIVTIRGSGSQLSIEHSKWDRLLGSLGYGTPPSLSALAGRAATDHPSWEFAEKALAAARTHHRAGEDYDALRDCLSSLEMLVTAPYNVASWKPLLTALPGQKATGIAELLSGLATYCNKIGHHRDRQRRDSDGNLPPQPLDHWETDLILGATQFLLAYALRLRLAGDLTESPPSHTAEQSPVVAQSVPRQVPADGQVAKSP